MRLLLDTHVFIWWTDESKRLNKKIHAQISRAHEVNVSIVSAWEIAIKANAGKLKTPTEPGFAIDASGFKLLPLTLSHTEFYVNLANHHNDPFDKMLVAQALAEELTLVTANSAFEPYGCRLLWA